MIFVTHSHIIKIPVNGAYIKLGLVQFANSMLI